MAETVEQWNHNSHYHSALLRTIPANARSALDVGCGEGALTRALAGIVPTVIGIDSDQPSIDEARRQDGALRVEYILGDFLEYPFQPESFDFVVSVATLHHMDASAALNRMRALLRPGGALAILGLAHAGTVRDLPFEIAGLVTHRALSATRGYWEHPSPKVWPPPESYTAMRRLAAELLPGARFRRHALWRYSITWSKPVTR
ncbi:class I SAM-dependent methyltransferase [Glaciibacter superstes]|uniref:class I SAM-dependent methyltransferase n=1 Tax=Glaciibacter superstes TaxID=501023 RepID=UPI00047EF1A4|nr:class I SAM-dependent methyltransferase [Glaciibacter superstes]